MIICLSAVIFTTGVGATVFNFCCDNCAEQFFSGQTCKENISIVKKEHSCCTKEKEAGHHEFSICGESTHSNENCCKAQRVSIDLDSFHFKPVVFTPFVWITNTYGDLTQVSAPEMFLTDFYPQIKAPPEIYTPRSYLAFIRILII